MWRSRVLSASLLTLWLLQDPFCTVSKEPCSAACDSVCPGLPWTCCTNTQTVHWAPSPGIAWRCKGVSARGHPWPMENRNLWINAHPFHSLSREIWAASHQGLQKIPWDWSSVAHRSSQLSHASLPFPLFPFHSSGPLWIPGITSHINDLQVSMYPQAQLLGNSG